MVEKNVSPENGELPLLQEIRKYRNSNTRSAKNGRDHPATLRTVVKKRAYYKLMKKKYKGKDESPFSAGTMEDKARFKWDAGELFRISRAT